MCLVLPVVGFAVWGLLVLGLLLGSGAGGPPCPVGVLFDMLAGWGYVVSLPGCAGCVALALLWLWAFWVLCLLDFSVNFGSVSFGVGHHKGLCTTLL